MRSGCIERHHKQRQRIPELENTRHESFANETFPVKSQIVVFKLFLRVWILNEGN